MLRRTVLAGLLAASAAPAAAQPRVRGPSVLIEGAWVRLPPPAAPTAAAYMVLHNRGRRADRLLSIESPAAQRVEVHEMSMAGGMMRMRAVPHLPLSPGGRAELAPGGLHLMLIGLRRPLRAGEPVPLTLRFERDGPRRIDAVVRAAAR